MEPGNPQAKAPVLSVSELLRSARDTLEHRYPLQWIGGEISNLRPAASGHLYFVLKDEQAQVDCVMFRSRAGALGWEPKDGLKVEARALVTLYEPRGRFQLTVEAMRRAGLGPLNERFLKLKAKLQAEGLFDPGRKRDIPEYPSRIGVLTSLAAAALRDVLTTLQRRNPSIPVIVYPVPVQGDGAAAKIAQMLAIAAGRAECDVLLLVRGGGSIEDLWPFNEEAVARAICASALPVVVGVGHETDFTIADFAADQRAPTPTAAAELVSPPRAELLARVAELGWRASREARRRIEYAVQAVDALARRLVHPADRLRGSRQLVGQLAARLASLMGHRIELHRYRLRDTPQRLSSLVARRLETA
ncbi:MAG: exodeoxyribonuclease VII large subunit, partial [Proteobacteria bacterium]|nr:exodeoxyribonuclease VII large subunit [Pseudomonadota bacterium]